MRDLSGNETGSVDRRLVDAIVTTSFVASATLSRVAAAHEISLTQLRLLGMLRDREPSMSAVADLLGLDRSSVTGLVDRSARRGLVRRERDRADGRGVRVVLTDAGRELASLGADEVAEALAPLLAELTADQARQLTGLLETLVAPAIPGSAESDASRSRPLGENAPPLVAGADEV